VSRACRAAATPMPACPAIIAMAAPEGSADRAAKMAAARPAAARIADAEGLEAVTMRRVAGELGMAAAVSSAPAGTRASRTFRTAASPIRFPAPVFTPVTRTSAGTTDHHLE